MSEVTIKDIASFVGCSIATVSRVINSPELVSEKTRAKVIAACKHFNYIPSMAAQNLSKKTTNTIGVLVPAIDNPFFGSLLRGVIEVTDREGFSLLCASSDDLSVKDKSSLDLFRRNRISGLLYTPAVDYTSYNERNNLLKILHELNTPVVLMDRQIEDLSIDGVYFDDKKMIYEATMFFLKAGIKKIGIINGAKNQVLSRIRYQGYLDAHLKLGVEINPEYVVFGKYTEESGYNSYNRMIAKCGRPEAIITCNNNISRGFLRALYGRGEKLDKDIFCIGLDRLYELDIIDYPFNYILHDGRNMGEVAVTRLINKIKNRDDSRIIQILEGKLVLKSNKLLRKLQKGVIAT